MDDSPINLEFIRREWYEPMIAGMFPILTGETPPHLGCANLLMDCLASRQFWREVLLLPFFPLVALYAICLLLSTDQMAEKIAAKNAR